MVQTTSRRGLLKVFLGYAAGVGKTYQMLSEAHRAVSEGVDLVVGYVESHGRRDTMALVDGLECVARTTIRYRDARFEELDVAAIVRRQPRVAVVDELPHTNVPGSRRTKRWEDVHDLLDAGIDVWTTMNVQHLESLNDQIWQSTGVRVRETIPDWVLKQADEVVMVDLTPQALLNRLARGAVYPPDRAQAALQNFFKESTLVALRELAIRQAAYVVESRLAADEAPRLSGATDGGDVRERLLLLVGPDPSTAALIRRGRRIGDQLRAECLAVYVSPTGDLGDLAAPERDQIERHLNFARALQIETRVLEGRDVADTLVGFARLNAVTQIFLARDRSKPVHSWLGPSLVDRIVNLAKGLQVTIVADRSLRRSE
jgi:two-component system sensor histidine kinase KdpD